MARLAVSVSIIKPAVVLVADGFDDFLRAHAVRVSLAQTAAVDLVLRVGSCAVQQSVQLAFAGFAAAGACRPAVEGFLPLLLLRVGWPLVLLESLFIYFPLVDGLAVPHNVVVVFFVELLDLAGLAGQRGDLEELVVQRLARRDAVRGVEAKQAFEQVDAGLVCLGAALADVAA